MYKFGAFMTLMCPIYAPRFDLLFSAIASGTKLLHVSNSAVSFVPEANIQDFQCSECYVCRELIALPALRGIDL